jgi:multidrug efflux pump subunit AcrB
MWISDFSIRNPVVTTVIMLAFVVFGALAMAKVPTSALRSGARSSEA